MGVLFIQHKAAAATNDFFISIPPNLKIQINENCFVVKIYKWVQNSLAYKCISCLNYSYFIYFNVSSMKNISETNKVLSNFVQKFEEFEAGSQDFKLKQRFYKYVIFYRQKKVQLTINSCRIHIILKGNSYNQRCKTKTSMYLPCFLT